MRVRAASALSEHPLATHAVGECVGRLLDAGGEGPPDLVVLFATEPHLGAFEDIARATRELLAPRTLVGAGAASVLAGRREVEERGALAAFALWSTGPGGVPAPVRIRATPTPEGPELGGLRALEGAEGALLLFADPFTLPVERVLEELARTAPGLTVIGGLASVARRPGGNRLLLDRTLHADGAVGVLVPPSIPVGTVVSQGCRPIGDPYVVTRAQRNLIVELAGRPAVERLRELYAAASDADRALLREGLQLGVVVDEHLDDPGTGDYLVRAVLGAERDGGGIVVGDVVEVGRSVRFHVRDAASADADLRALLARYAAGPRPDTALLFTCTGRGAGLFGSPHHDARAVRDVLGDVALGGCFCGGELGPIGGRSHLHGYSASLAGLVPASALPAPGAEL